MRDTTVPPLMKLKELPLGQPGLDYVRHWLGSETTFAQAAQPIVSKGGTVFAVVPEETDLKRALDFDTSLDIRIGPPNEWLSNRMIARCHAKPRSVIVFDEPQAGRRSDPNVWDRVSPMFVNQNFIYPFIAGGDITADAICLTMKELGSFLIIAAFIDYPFTKTQIDADGAIDDRLMRQLVSNMQELYMSAYDRESYVVWQR